MAKPMMAAKQPSKKAMEFIDDDEEEQQ